MIFVARILKLFGSSNVMVHHEDSGEIVIRVTMYNY